ncbi:MAG TPA: histidinol dehydrogenase [Pyrinomonadaceae bacterium]
MIRIISSSDVAGREELISRLVARSVGIDADLLALVSNIINEVRQRGDAALIDYAKRFDRVEMTAAELRVSAETLKKTAATISDEVLNALREAIANVRIFHERQREDSWTITTTQQSVLGQRITPIEAVGLYVPGGTAAYPSSVIMNVVPAQVAGVERIVVTTPPETIRKNAAVAATLLELGVEKVYAVGGAQAIAALAFGTETIKAVDKITGPGNKYVAAAKKLVFGVVGIDSIAGPSEVVIVADNSARADYVAADMLAQAEHGEDASSILLTTSQSLAKKVVAELERQLANLPRQTIAHASLQNFGAIVLVEDLQSAAQLVNQLAPEHVELLTTQNEALSSEIKHAGAIFIGEYSPEAVGDYFAGPNHVLPTGRTARFSSALGVYDFVKRSSLISYSPQQMNDAARKIAAIAEAEGLQAHANSALIRIESR